jgi:hypothetical protein
MAIPEARTTAASYVDEYGVSIISAKIPCGGRDIACSSQESFSSALHSDRALKSYLCIEDSFAIIKVSSHEIMLLPRYTNACTA